MAPRKKDTIQHEALPTVESDIQEFYQDVMAVIFRSAEEHKAIDNPLDWNWKTSKGAIYY